MKIRIMVATGDGNLLNEGVREISGVIRIFYILIKALDICQEHICTLSICEIHSV